MESKFYQACHTRVGMHEGWKSIHNSPDIPLQVLSFFEKTEIGNEVKKGVPLDENKNPRWMLEILGNNSCVGISRVQYGLTDAFGRPNRFAHAFLFENAYEMLREPKQLLSIADSNFKTTPEETEKIPEQLEAEPGFDMEDALTRCGMDKERYVNFIKCIYYALSTNTQNTIYVLTDGSDAMARNLLYLSYQAIPYSLRVRITASTCAEIEGQNKMLVFGTKHPDHGRFVDPRTGENNILTKALESRWERNPFVAWFAKNCYAQADNRHLFDQMEKMLSDLGDKQMRDMDALRLTFALNCEEPEGMGDEEPENLLYDLLALPLPNSVCMEEYGVKFLRMIIDNGIHLNESTEELLISRQKQAVTREFQNGSFAYFSAVICDEEPVRGSRLLAGVEENKDMFAGVRTHLSRSENGMKILLCYYLGKAENIASKSGCRQDDLVAVYRSCSDLAGIAAKVGEELQKKSIRMTKEKIRNGESYEGALRSFNDLSGKIGAGNLSAAWVEILGEYSRQITADFQTDRIREYRKFCREYPMAAGTVRHMIDGMDDIAAGNYGSAAAILETGKLSTEQIGILYKYAKKHHVSKCTDMRFWEAMASAADYKNVVDLMLQCEAEMLLDISLLEDVVEEDSSYWGDLSVMRNFCKKCRNQAAKDEEKEELLEDCINFLSHEIRHREAEEKRYRKALEKSEKRKEKVQKGAKPKQKGEPELKDKPEPQKKKGLFGKWF